MSDEVMFMSPGSGPEAEDIFDSLDDSEDDFSDEGFTAPIDAEADIEADIEAEVEASSTSPAVKQVGDLMEFGTYGVLDKRSFTPSPDWQPTVEDLCHRIAALEQMNEVLPWIGGDLMVFGFNTFGEEQMYQYLPRSGSTLGNWLRVALKFPPDRRIFDLSWTHYLRAAGIEDPDEAQRLLKLAAVNGLSSVELGDAVRDAKRGENPRGDSEVEVVPAPMVMTEAEQMAVNVFLALNENNFLALNIRWDDVKEVIMAALVPLLGKEGGKDGGVV